MYRIVVVGTDGSATAKAAVAHAVELAQVTGATLHLVCAAQPAYALSGSTEVGATGLDPVAAAKSSADAVLGEAVAEVEAAGVAVERHNPAGPAASCLVDVAKAVSADLIVVGSRGMQGARRILGSTPNGVTHHAPCHVLLVHTR